MRASTDNWTFDQGLYRDLDRDASGQRERNAERSHIDRRAVGTVPNASGLLQHYHRRLKRNRNQTIDGSKDAT